MSHDYTHIHYQTDGAVATLTLNTPPLNILDIALMREMIEALRRAESDSAVTTLVFRGAGDKAFSAGASIPEHAPDRVREMLTTFHDVFRALAQSALVTVAGVHGLCLGGGCELAVMCDFVVAEETAKFGVPEIKLGCFPPVAAALFPSLIGRKHAERLMFTGEIIRADEARTLGLITHLAPAGAIAAETAALVNQLTDKSTAVLRLLRRSEPGWREEFLRNLERAERVFLEELIQLKDMQEGLTAYSEKRPPVWRNQ
ncbi:MAG TPA: enoyl-CoA hydratase/isomerase family protein [candidate division Zixibacteria bacterium]|nr:enoyl-CoA hydratase/isomerase family protein [candidate division Zixibacteria bacterium]